MKNRSHKLTAQLRDIGLSDDQITQVIVVVKNWVLSVFRL